VDEYSSPPVTHSPSQIKLKKIEDENNANKTDKEGFIYYSIKGCLNYGDYDRMMHIDWPLPMLFALFDSKRKEWQKY